MPRVSFSTDYFLGPSYRTLDSSSSCFDRYYQASPLITRVNDNNEQSSTLSPSDIDEILSRKLYEQLKVTSRLENEQNIKEKSECDVNSTPSIMTPIDPELTLLIDRFFDLTYLNTIPMVNLLATAVTINFLKENIRELDKKLQQQQQQTTHTSSNIKRGNSLLYESVHNEDDDNLSWISAPP